MKILRTKEISLLKNRLKTNPIVAILGPRQCGKTTLSQQLAMQTRGSVTTFDLEDPRDLNRLQDPLMALEDLKGLVIIDEIQRRPDLFPVLRVLVDRHPSTRYLVLGSASSELIHQSSESLAGRISYIEMGGFGFENVLLKDIDKLWIRGGFPKSFLAVNEKVSYQWRQDFVTTFLERDIPNLGIKIPAPSLRRFWSMLAHGHGQIFNASEIGKSLGFSDHTAHRYLDLLSGTFMVRQLRPWFYNTKKRIVKRPKIYFRDSGILHALLSLENRQQIIFHPKLGSSWEGFALEEVIKYFQLKEEEVFFWCVHGVNSGEIDLVFQRKGKFFGVEVKYAQAPQITPSIRTALRELSLSHVWIVYPGKTNYALNRQVSVPALNHCSQIKF